MRPQQFQEDHLLERCGGTTSTAPSSRSALEHTPLVDIYFLILLAICYLWSPSKNNLQYAYMDELSSVEQDEEEEG